MARTSFKQIYDESELFKHYVDKYVNNRKITVEEALEHEIIHQYAKYLGELNDKD